MNIVSNLVMTWRSGEEREKETRAHKGRGRETMIWRLIERDTETEKERQSVREKERGAHRQKKTDAERDRYRDRKRWRA